jgi:YegS/Rv2252/BmrU family lipid kinase
MAPVYDRIVQARLINGANTSPGEVSMRYKRVIVIVNPASGKEQPILHPLNSIFHQAEIDWDVAITKAEGDARRLAQQAGDCRVDAVAVFGGDGTVAEVAAGLQGSHVPLAILPGGTTNATARILGIPVELRAAAGLLTSPETVERAMDLGRTGDNYFFGAIGMGIPGEVAEQTSRAAKDRLGNLAYALASLRAVPHTRVANYHINLDGQEVHCRGLACVILNHGAGLLTLAPPIDSEDGLLDVAVVPNPNVRTALKLVANMVFRDGSRAPVLHWRARRVRVVSDPEQPVQADGEVASPGHIEAEAVPQGVRFIVPAQRTART